ncbi:hypothetical protein ACFSB1_17480 [Halopseudomonas phragmitis]|uniref:Uncharacterized protein n=1 Tax=Halopseudomonas phragmitis TaxID=1931241 RepID=A0A1V0B2W4_9GAMM|nr:hypothetical protein [Halopseudomonas phragmitis]AQZ94282.1 hypothetical protein BVH74_05735 [Halopseudomonas phragmitis]
MSKPEKKGSADTRYEPNVSISALDKKARFNADDFYRHLTSEFEVTEKGYQPLKELMAAYGIDSTDILGSDYPEDPDSPPRNDLMLFEKAKLAVLARRMSVRSKKWRPYALFAKPSMSAVLGSKAPSSKYHKQERDKMLLYYLTELKSGIPAPAQGSAQPLLENNDGFELAGGRFEQRSMGMTYVVANFLAARQREVVVKNNWENGWRDSENKLASWPPHVPPEYGASEAVDITRKAFVAMLEAVPPEASKDMARVRLIKDHFLDAESSHWREACELDKSLLADIPPEISRLDLRVTRDHIKEGVASALGVEVHDLPGNLVRQAECLVRLYGHKHCPNMTNPERLRYFRELQAPHQTAMAAVLLFSLKRTSRQIVLSLPGETHSKVYVHKAFLMALAAAGVDLNESLETNDQQLTSVVDNMDTKVLTYLTSLFSIVTMADDGHRNHLKMEYLASHLKVKIERRALLAELPQLLKPYSCRLAYQLMGDFMSCLYEHTKNPMS